MEQRTILTTSKRGLQVDSFPFRLYQKAKKFGIWNPADIDFTQDQEDWRQLTAEQQNDILRLISQFQAGEEAVTLDLLPLIMAIAKEGRLEEEMFLTTFLFEEAKHTEFFRLVLNALGETGDLSGHHTETYKTIFYEILPTTMDRLLTDQSPEAIAEAATVYNMFVEGVLAETGYYSFYQNLETLGLMPGLLKGIGNLKRDESRHIGYGTFLLQRLICEHPHLYEYVEGKMQELTPLAIRLNQEGFRDNDVSTFGNQIEDTMNFTLKQLSVRMEILSRARGKRIEEIYRVSESEMGVL
ncbi:R2-like ligand-binding oxidase [Mesobacillus sp. AQ2]|jgi:ribonucleoside-diphosphate reductase beta chain|uniref:R2-like ligand-binding oxidase n=1 Tax=unclassified Mesobacillus TaxID=2675270 RepID=UPI00203E25B7|nr:MULTISPECIES: R2-like ligand-binding oxidase [unclassified Mesobacillus]MCM3121585.1 R2-like ligand-binding oxidase [Mesobacillus sp. MER 33]MCM3231549.1 R2-like ligand-binding oxidase [Mesobacillus sp. MER 48]WHX38527.1 R2-like ligand-binding oxidase [Mesobacillus sp. AQ2]